MLLLYYYYYFFFSLAWNYYYYLLLIDWIYKCIYMIILFDSYHKLCMFTDFMVIDFMEVDMYMIYSNIFDIYHHRWGIIYDVWCVDHINIYNIETCHICDQVCSITVLTSYNGHLYIRHFCVDHTYNICMISTSYIYDSSSFMIDSWYCFFLIDALWWLQ